MRRDSLLVRSLRYNEFKKFISGEKPYFMGSPHGEDRPQDSYLAYSSEFQPLIDAYISGNNKDFSRSFIENLFEKFFRELTEYLEFNFDRSKEIYVVAGWIWAFLDHFNEMDLEDLKSIRAIFLHLKNSDLVKKIDLYSVRFSDDLIRDKRWAGATWNSEDGLLGPVKRTVASCMKLIEEIEKKTESTP